MRLGLVNMMPDKALRVTERQFAALCGLADPAQFVLLDAPGIIRGPAAAADVAQRYRPVSTLPDAGLDALVISGANISDPRLPAQPFWAALCGVFAHVRQSGLPTLFSCLATHAVLEAEHGELRRPVAPKVWGVFGHDIAAPAHPLLAGLDAPLPVPHSRHNQVDSDQFGRAGYAVLLESPEVGAHLAVSADGRRLLMQGHPEYEAISLLKEHKREVGRWQDGERPDYPPAPAGYLSGEGSALLAAHAEACAAGPPWPVYPETEIAPGLAAPWAGPARRIVARWLATAVAG